MLMPALRAEGAQELLDQLHVELADLLRRELRVVAEEPAPADVHGHRAEAVFHRHARGPRSG